MRRRLTDLLRRLLSGGAPRSSRPPRTSRPPRRQPTPRPAGGRSSTSGAVIEYSPCLDGDPDPGEIVWTWVPYEDDPRQGKDRPVVIIGRRGANLLGVPLTSKRKDNEAQVDVGTGPWDREGRPSYAKVERLLDVVPSEVRREGAVLDRRRFDAVVDGVRRAHRG